MWPKNTWKRIPHPMQQHYLSQRKTYDYNDILKGVGILKLQQIRKRKWLNIRLTDQRWLSIPAKRLNNVKLSWCYANLSNVQDINFWPILSHATQTSEFTFCSCSFSIFLAADFKIITDLIYVCIFSYALMSECWDMEPDRRPTFGSISRTVKRLEHGRKVRIDGSSSSRIVLESDLI